MDTSEPLVYPYSNDAVSAAVIDQLARTKGWTRFFSVMMWIGAVFLILGGVSIALMGAFAGSLGTEGEELAAQFAGVIGLVGIGVVYVLLSLVYIYPALKLGAYSSRIADLMSTPSEGNLVAALNEQRAFWKYVGVMMIVCFAVYAVAIVAMIVVTAAAGVAATSG